MDLINVMLKLLSVFLIGLLINSFLDLAIAKKHMKTEYIKLNKQRNIDIYELWINKQHETIQANMKFCKKVALVLVSVCILYLYHNW
nr:hypothetical protein VW1E2_00047 [Enterobacter sp.]